MKKYIMVAVLGVIALVLTLSLMPAAPDVQKVYASSGIEILRPNAGGDETNLDYWDGETLYGPNVLHNFKQVDDVTPDDGGPGGTFVIAIGTTKYLRDLYNLPNHTTGSGVINSIKIYFRCEAAFAVQVPSPAYPSLKTNGVTINGGMVYVGDEWETYSQQWNTNPVTRTAWTWNEIDALQIGIRLHNENASNENACTQLYVEVNYSKPVPLLGEYAPVLYLHPYEGYYNDPINTMLDESDLMLLENPIGIIQFRDLIRNGPIGESELPGPSANGTYYLDMWSATSAPLWESWRAEKPDPTRFKDYPLTVYGRQVDKTYGGHNYIVLQYWFFYPYNDWHNCHEGDIERVQIILDKATGTPMPINVTFGQHRGGKTVPWNGGVSFIEGTHPKVFVAQGSHASYPTDGDHPVGPCTDETSSTGLVSFPTGYVNEYDIPTGNKKGYTLTDISGEPSWVKWSGIWGFYVPGSTGGLGQSGPPSPANVMIHGINVWNDPIAWANDPGSPWIIGQATGSVRLHAYDSGGNHTGLNETGWIEAEIPGTYFYTPASNQSDELMWIYTSEDLTFTLEATGSGGFNFTLAKCQSDEVTTNYTHIEVTQNTTATIDTNQTIPIMQIDLDGDGTIDQSKFPDSANTSTLIGKVSFAGRGDPPNDRWIETFKVKFFYPPTHEELSWSQQGLYATTNSSGYFTLSGIPPGTYDIGIKGKTSLSEMVYGVVLN
jgi:hypothetical protein